MKGLFTAMILSAVSAAVLAQSTPVGLWRNFDDKTGAPKGEVQITESGGVLTGKVTKVLVPGFKPDDICTICPGDRKDQPRLGLEVIRGAKKAADGEYWEGGKILDPENGKIYSLKMTPIEGGKKLEVKGSFGPFGRTQTWIRLP